MKRLLRREFVIVGTAALALLGWSTVSAATGPRAHHVLVHQVAVQTEPSAAPAAEPEPEPEDATPAPVAAEPAQAPVENEPAENENEAAEPAEDEAEAAENENEAAENENPAPPTAAPAPTTSSRTFSLVGGTVTFTCTGSRISLDSAVPATGFQAETGTEDGGQEIEIRFESDSHRSEIKAACSGGMVQAVEIQEEND